MADFKLCISDPKTGKTVQREVKEDDAQPFVGMMIGQAVKGETINLTGYEFVITGGSDKAGFPMRKGIKGIRKSFTIRGGVGFRNKKKNQGLRKRKTVCGAKINDNISQINLKITKQGKASLFEKKAEAPKEDKKPVEKPKKEEKKEKPLPETKKEAPKKEEKPKEEPKKAEEKKPAEKKEEKPVEKKEEPKK